MGKRVAFLCLGFIALESIGQSTVEISYDREVIVVLEDMYIVRPVRNTCGELATAYDEAGSPIAFDNHLYLDSLNETHISLQVGNLLDDKTLPPCNITLFTNKGILSLELVFNNETRALVRAFRESDLLYKYDKERVAATASRVPGKGKTIGGGSPTKSDSRIQQIYDQTNEPDFSQESADVDLVEFTLTNIVFDGSKVYMFIVLNNKSSIAYELAGTYFNQTIKVKGRKSAQENENLMTILNKIEPPDKIIQPNEFKVLCYELDKFTLTKKNEIKIIIIENNGRRRGNIDVSRKTFNDNSVTFQGQ